MLITVPKEYHRKWKAPKKKALTPAPPPGVPINLLSADYQVHPVVAITLTFDWAVDVAGFSGSAIDVFDGNVTGQLYQGASALLMDDVTVKVLLESIGSDSDYGTFMNASSGSGIVAVDDGGTWAGMSDYALPDPRPGLTMQEI